MPIYEYKCNDCNEKFEVTQNVFHLESPKCPKCKSEKTRVFSRHLPGYHPVNRPSKAAASAEGDSLTGQYVSSKE
ncbi:MAG: zinc ribbon domain-containing protein [Dehalococcoidales bacterium]|nr:zinc ribbon domain-containing protein [Dehalococcoidales bacterium]